MAAIITIAVLALAGGATAAGAVDPGTDPASLESQFVSKINGLRASQGLAPLAVHGNLVSKARGWAAHMADAGAISHSNVPDGITADWQVLGENVGRGGSVDALHDAFVASPTHYANLVDARFEYVGVGVVVTDDGTIYTSHVFMQLAESVESTGSDEPADEPVPDGASSGSGDESVQGRPDPGVDDGGTAESDGTDGTGDASDAEHIVSVLNRLAHFA